jgi:thiamine biosynthesis lipoprotein
MRKNLGRRTGFLWFLLSIIPFSMSPAQENHDSFRFEYSHSSMGSLFTIIGYGSDTLHARAMANSAFSMIDRLDLIMSDYNPESELMKLSRQSGNGEFIPVTTELFHVIRQSLFWSAWTGGIFDITIGPFSQLWRRAGRKDVLPDSIQIHRAATRVGYQYIQLDTINQSVMLVKPGMQLDLGGIAKGYTVDEIFHFFKDQGYDRLLVDGGGDIRVGNNPPGTDGWKIRISGGNGLDSLVYLSDCAVATSGDIYRFAEINGKRYSHIINPFTGYGIQIPRTVTVIAPDCTEADVLASTLSIAGVKEGFRLLKKQKEVKALILEDRKGKLKEYRFASP